MALRDINSAKDFLEDAKSTLESISFDTPIEPSDAADADVWRDFALDLLNLLQDAEHDVAKALKQITGE